MGRLNFTYRERDRAVDKIKGTKQDGLVVGAGSERAAWYYVDGLKAFKVRVGQVHSGDMRPGTARDILRSLKLDLPGFNLLVKCDMTQPEYHAYILDLKGRGVI